MKKYIFLLFFISNFAFAQNAERLFIDANDFYKKEQYQKALELYKQIDALGVHSSELYHNLGNTYYKLNKVGPSIYYYEKALLLNPQNEDVQNNLVFARRLSLDNIEELPKTVFQKFNTNYLQKLSYNQWAMVVVGFSFLVSLFFLIYYFSSSSSTKRLFFITSLICVILLVASTVITFNQYSFAKNNKVAIVFAEETEIRNAPTFNSEKVFTLHEGTKVVVLDIIDEWKKIKIADGKIGWFIADEIKEL